MVVRESDSDRVTDTKSIFFIFTGIGSSWNRCFTIAAWQFLYKCIHSPSRCPPSMCQGTVGWLLCPLSSLMESVLIDEKTGWGYAICYIWKFLEYSGVCSLCFVRKKRVNTGEDVVRNESVNCVQLVENFRNCFKSSVSKPVSRLLQKGHCIRGTKINILLALATPLS